MFALLGQDREADTRRRRRIREPVQLGRQPDRDSRARDLGSRRHLRKLRDDRTSIYDTRTGRRVGVTETEPFDYAWSPTTDEIAANVQQSSDLLPVLAVCAPGQEGDTWDLNRFDAYPSGGEPRWSPDGRTIAATAWSRLGMNDAETVVWDVASAAPDARWMKESTIIRGRTVGWSNDGRTLLLHNGDGIIARNLARSSWDMPFQLGEDARIVLAQPNTGGMDADVPEGALIVQWNNDDGLLLVFGCDGLGVWSRDSGVELARIPQQETLLAASFNSEADRIATVTADGALRVCWPAEGDRSLSALVEPRIQPAVAARLLPADRRRTEPPLSRGLRGASSLSSSMIRRSEGVLMRRSMVNVGRGVRN